MLNHTDLKSLEGSPRKVGGDFLCKGHDIPTLEGAPEEIIQSGEILDVINGVDEIENPITIWTINNGELVQTYTDSPLVQNIIKLILSFR